ncbi:hypothetical protein H920_09404 [Fukomys damarensis]|uniref:Uncharacterized protein n=1 Tax=Fukomys damarensis TaxID=885580 RepID=A0A091E2I6_FUKDA|nr:hypothetical protein H920_09404 [Fukomys damarensis]
MFASIWYAKKLGRRFVHNARKAKSEKGPSSFMRFVNLLDGTPKSSMAVKDLGLGSTVTQPLTA